MMEWTYSPYRHRALIIDGPFTLCTIVCTREYATRLFQSATIDDIMEVAKTLNQSLLTPSDLHHLFPLQSQRGI